LGNPQALSGYFKLSRCIAHFYIDEGEDMNVQALQQETEEFDRMDMSDTLRNWFVGRLSELLGVKQDDVEIDLPFDRYGLDSSAAIGLTGELEELLGVELEPTLLYNYPTVEALVQYLSKQLEESH
jgi:acyl carrier protein